jgi:hypothetical protein
MIWINIITGVLFILIGFAVKRFPDLISGYNTMPKKEKAKVDVPRMTSVFRKVFVLMGALLIVVCALLEFFHCEMEQFYAVMIISFAGVIYLVVKGSSFTTQKQGGKGRRRQIITLTILAVIVVATTCSVLWGAQEPEVSISSDKVTISGAYGFAIATQDIETVQLAEDMPAILLRTNGLGLGDINKGNFKLEGIGGCKLFLQQRKPPYIRIVYSGGKVMYLNFKSKDKTIEVYERLKASSPLTLMNLRQR